MNPMKNKLRNLDDIRREKQKLLLEIGIHEYALNLNFRQIKDKFSFVSFSAYVIDIVREHFRAKVPSFLSGLISGLWKAIMKKKS
jgi:hypothetical protein